MDTRELDGMQGHGHSFEHGSVGEGHLRRKFVDDVGGDGDVFGEGPGAAIFAAGDAGDLAVLAEINFAAETEFALTAVDSGIEGDAVAWRQGNDFGPHGSDSAGGFMSHNNGRNAAAGRAVISVDIASADATRCYLNEDLTGTA